jgi:hypothetical protein
MISWVVIGVFVLVGLMVIKANHLQHKFWIFLLVAVTLFLYATFSIVSSQNEFDLKSTEGIMHAGKVYMVWLSNGFSNLKAITGNAVNMDWTTNSSDLNKTSKETGTNKK